MYTWDDMVLPGEIREGGVRYAASLEWFGAYAFGNSRDAACAALASTIRERAEETGPLKGFEIEVTDDGEQTLYVTSNDPARLTAMLLRYLRSWCDLSLAEIAKAMNARSRNGWAQYERGRIDPSLSKLQEMLEVVAPELMLAIIPRSARVIPRWDEEADDAAELSALMADPSPANVAALRAKGAMHRERIAVLRTTLAARRPAKPTARTRRKEAARLPTKHTARQPTQRSARQATKHAARQPTKHAAPTPRKPAKAARSAAR